MVLGAILSIGLLNGFAHLKGIGPLSPAAPRHAASAPVQRAQTMALLFEEFCIGALRHMARDPQGQLQRKVVNGAPRWVDEAAGLSLFFGQVPPQSCAVSDDIAHLSAAEKAELAQIVAQKMPHWAPQLALQPAAGTSEVFLRSWAYGQNSSWGIALAQKTADGPMRLTITLPAS